MIRRVDKGGIVLFEASRRAGFSLEPGFRHEETRRVTGHLKLLHALEQAGSRKRQAKNGRN